MSTLMDDPGRRVRVLDVLFRKRYEVLAGRVRRQWAALCRKAGRKTRDLDDVVQDVLGDLWIEATGQETVTVRRDRKGRELAYTVLPERPWPDRKRTYVLPAKDGYRPKVRTAGRPLTPMEWCRGRIRYLVLDQWRQRWQDTAERLRDFAAARGITGEYRPSFWRPEWELRDRGLTTRQTTVYQALVVGFSTDDIAGCLHVHVRTILREIEAIRGSIEAIGARDKRRAGRNGWLPPIHRATVTCWASDVSPVTTGVLPCEPMYSGSPEIVDPLARPCRLRFCDLTRGLAGATPPLRGWPEIVDPLCRSRS